MRTFLFTLILLLAISCGKTEKASGFKTTVSLSTAIGGLYELCTNLTDYGLSIKSTLLYNPPSIVEIDTFYDGDSCNSGSELWNQKYIMIAPDTSSVVLVGAIVTSLSNSDVTDSNSVSYCTYNNWVLNVPKNILGKDCGGNTILYGQSLNISFSKSGTSLNVATENGSVLYPLLKTIDFSDQGHTLTNGNYAYSVGERAFFFIFSSGTYSVTTYDKETFRYYREDGTYVSTPDNQLSMTVSSYTPDCGTDEGTTHIFAIDQTSLSLGIRGEDETEGLILEKIPYTEVQFRAAYIPGTYSAGCF